jgi:hypothetical protein
MTLNDVQPGTSQPAAEPIRLVPIAEQVAGLSDEQVETRWNELKQDREFGAKYIDSKPGSEERNLLDALARRRAGMPVAEAAPAPAPDPVLDAPAGAEDYKVEDLLGRPIALGESEELVRNSLLPAAHRLGLSQGDLTSVAACVQRPLTREQCQATLEKLWGRDERYEQGLADFDAAVTNPQDIALLEQYPQLGFNPWLIASVVNAYRRRQGRR